jgi:hypothetical protein
LRTSITSGAETYNKVFSSTRITFGSKSAPAQIGNKNEVTGDGINGIYVVSESNWFFYKSNPEAVAVTNNIYTSDEIIETDIFFLVKDSAIAASVTSPKFMNIAFNRFTSTLLDAFSLVKSRTEDSSINDLHGHVAMALTNSEGVKAVGMYSNDFSTVKAKAFAVHEFGHSLGRCHTANKTSIMQPQLSTSVYYTKPLLSDYDLDILAEHYSVIE